MRALVTSKHIFALRRPTGKFHFPLTFVRYKTEKRVSKFIGFAIKWMDAASCFEIIKTPNVPQENLNNALQCLYQLLAGDHQGIFNPKFINNRYYSQLIKFRIL